MLFDLIGITLFGIEVRDAAMFDVTGFKLSWCFILCTVATVIFAFVGILVVFELLTFTTNPYTEESFSEPHSAQEIGSSVIGRTGVGTYPRLTREIQMNLGDGVHEFSMEDPGVKTIALA